MLGFLRRAASDVLGLQRQASSIQPPSSGGWWPIIREPFTGAWQQNGELRQEQVLAYSAVYACVGLIAEDIAKMSLRLMERDRATKVWFEADSSNPYWRVLRKPNRWQTRLQFVQLWQISLSLAGNAYIYKRRDARGIVNEWVVLPPHRVKILVSDDGEVYYEISRDVLSGVEQETVTLPASEIIHDRGPTLWHPLVGVSPLYACGLAASQGREIQKQSDRFFQRSATPSGILSAPGSIKTENAAELKRRWEENYGGENVGRIAVLGDGLKFEQLTMTAVDAQLIEQLRWTAEDVARAFRVPAHKIGVGQLPSAANVAALDQQYYSGCLQSRIEQMEILIDEGLGLTTIDGRTMGVEFDLRDLIRMDPQARMAAAVEGVKGAVLTPNEARAGEDLPPLDGGSTVYMQQQNYSLAALAQRDATNPLATPPAPATLPPAPTGEDEMFAETIRALTEQAVESRCAAQAAQRLSETLQRRLEELTERLQQVEAKAREPGPAGKDGTDGLPGKDGASVSVSDLRPIIAADVVARVSDIHRDLLDRVEKVKHLALEHGPRGDDGKDGKDGASVTAEDVRPIIEQAHATWALAFERSASERLERWMQSQPKPADGKHGLGFDDLSVIDQGRGRFVLKFTKGDELREFPIRVGSVQDCGVWRDVERYERGDGVTYAGSWWIACKDQPEGRPGASGDWRLAVKRGRDGKGAT